MAKQCLEEHREELSGGCREEIDSMIERRVRDFRLDSRLKKACEKDIGNMCAWGGDMGTMDTYDSMGEWATAREGHCTAGPQPAVPAVKGGICVWCCSLCVWGDMGTMDTYDSMGECASKCAASQQRR